MNDGIAALPEMRGWGGPHQVIRLPPGEDIPLTARVRRVLDSEPMRRLQRISQLGLVAQVYPGAVHSRLEHSLGVYGNALRFLQRLQHDERFCQWVDRRAAERFIFTALIHDLGHWPFCHPIEDLRLEGIPEHEARARDLLHSGDLAAALREDWHVTAEEVVGLLEGTTNSPTEEILQSLLSGPLDIDKLDYLQRDSLHAGVPYGRNFDAARLIGSLCVHPEKPRLAITEKGRTAAEMMVFSRYVMFSEVYWHHAVRSATAMLQRAIWMLQPRFDLAAVYNLDEAAWIAAVRRAADGTSAQTLVDGLFGARRQLFKRVAEFNVLDQSDLHRTLARKPYAWLVRCSEGLASAIARQIGRPVGVADILIDAPPVKLEVDIAIDVVAKNGRTRQLAEVSPVAAALARRQFDDQVKRVRVFVRPDLRAALPPGFAVDWLEKSAHQVK